MTISAHDHGQDGDDHRDNWPVDEKFRHGTYFVSNGFGLTCIPWRTFCIPSATTRSPGLRPSLMSHSATHAIAHFDGADIHFVVAVRRRQSDSSPEAH